MDDETASPVRRVVRPHGIQIPYRVLGSGAAPRLVYAHALTASGLLAGREAFEPFLEASWSVAALDQRGHGEATPSTDPEAYRVEELGRDLIAVLDDLGWSSAWLCGASMGAAPALSAAVSFPHRVDGLLLLAPAFGERRNAAADMFARIARSLAEGGLEAGAAAWRTEMRARGLPEPAIEQHVSQLRLHDPDAMAVWLREIGAWTIGDAIRQLPAHDLRVATIAWEDDDIHPAALARRIAELAGSGAFETIDPGASDAGPDLLFRTGLELLGRFTEPT